MKTIDCCGMTCPLPVIETKSALEKEAVNEICVVVDSLVSSENVMRFLQSQGFTVSVMQLDGKYRIEGTKTLELTEPLPASGPVSAKKTLVFIDGETVGRGSEELGAILMRSFLFTLKELNPLPWRIIFINSGVKLAVEGSPLLTVLGELADLGLEIISCGTCLDYYQIKDKLAAGRVSNMYEIASSFLEATNVIKP
jgi:selenium metabolism protein YedF